jgi:hypothetical protein
VSVSPREAEPRRVARKGGPHTMNVSIRRALIAILITGSAVVANGCYHIKGGAVPEPSGFTSLPSGSPTSVPTGNCQGLGPNTTAVIEVSPEIRPTKDPTYGNIWGYAPEPPSGGFVGTAAVARVAPAAIVQFVNVDTTAAYSAVGLGTGGFPPVPHTFPANTQNPVGNAMGSGTWSTGRLGVNFTTGCYSQPLSVPSVTGGGSVAVYFGDHDLYNFGYRDVLVVSNGAASTDTQRRPLPLQMPPPSP